MATAGDVTDTSNISDNLTLHDLPHRHNVNAVSIKNVPFWKKKPDLWFLQLEAQFELSGITQDKTKFYHVIGALDESVIHVVSDVVSDPPTSNRYTTLKQSLISRLSSSDNQKIKQLLTDLTLGDLQPSQLLREMQSLNKGKLSDEVLKPLWLQRLPPNMQSILACNPGSLSLLASCADRITEVNTQQEVFSMSSSMKSEDKDKSIQHLTNRIDDLTRMFELHFSHRREQSRSRSSRGNFRSRSNSRGSRNRLQKDWCWYHQNFQSKAKKCIPPCSFKPSGGSINPAVDLNL